MMTRRIFQAATLMAAAGAFVAVPGIAAAEDSKTTATGEWAVVGGDKAAACEKAVQRAQRAAVEQAVGVMVDSSTLTKNYQTVDDTIYSKAAGYISNFKVTKKDVADGVCSVTIEATVGKDKLETSLNALGVLQKQMNMPRVLAMITEQNVGSSNTAAWWSGGESFSLDLGAAENALINAWIAKDFTFVDRQAIQGKLSVGKALGAEPSDADIKEFALTTGAEVVVIGKAFANDIGPIMGTQMHSLRANISLRVLTLDTGGIIGTSTKTATVGHIDPTTGGTKALTTVAEKAGEELLEKIIAAWSKKVMGARTVQVTFSNVGKSKYLSALKSFLGNDIRGVEAVRQRAFRNKVAEFEVDIMAQGSAGSLLAEELEAKSFGDFGIEVEEITDNTLKVTLTKK